MSRRIYHYNGRGNGKTKRSKVIAEMTHDDLIWIDKKIDGHGGGYTYSSTNGVARITFIGNKSTLQIGWYNIILYFKWLKRRIKHEY